METFSRLAFILPVLVALWLIFRARKRADAQTPARFNWHVSHVLSDTTFNFYGTLGETIVELRVRVPGAVIVHIDPEYHVLFFRFAAAV